MSQYIASVPSDGQVKPEILKYFERFYEISDMPDAHQLYSEQYTKNAKLIMGPNEMNGRDGKPPSPLAFVTWWNSWRQSRQVPSPVCLPECSLLMPWRRRLDTDKEYRDCESASRNVGKSSQTVS